MTERMSLVMEEAEAAAAAGMPMFGVKSSLSVVEALGVLKIEAKVVKGKLKAPSRTEILKAWLQALWDGPGAAEEVGKIWEVGSVLLSPQGAAALEEGPGGQIEIVSRACYLSAEALVVDALELVLPGERYLDRACGVGVYVARILKSLKPEPPRWIEGLLAGWEQGMGDAIEACDEIRDIGWDLEGLNGLAVLWSTRVLSGPVGLAGVKVRLVPAIEQAARGRGAPWAMVEISLPVWVALSSEGRAHLMGQALLALDPERRQIRRPDVVAWVGELETWGVSGKVQGQAVEAVMAEHPETVSASQAGEQMMLW